jgi:CxxC-x17-CxxC domain-containing protein
MNYTDKWLVCAECGREFLWDAGEQAWYHDQHLNNQPLHCKSCRDHRRAARRKEPRLHAKVRCECCGAPIFVPFVPHGTKPVYCRSCMRVNA